MEAINDAEKRQRLYSRIQGRDMAKEILDLVGEHDRFFLESFCEAIHNKIHPPEEQPPEPKLQSKVERLKAEVNRLKSQVQRGRDCREPARKLTELQTQKIVDLRAEVERLRELLQEVLDCSISFKDVRVRYKKVQIDVGLLNDIKKALEGE